MIAGFRRSAGACLPAVPGGLVPPEREDQSKPRKSDQSKKKGRREVWPLRPDLAPFLFLVECSGFLSLADLCFRWGQPTGEHLRAAVCGLLRHLIRAAKEMLNLRF
jgi:hypothetical protein